MSAMDDYEPREKSSLFRDLMSMRVEYLVLVIAALVTGNVIRDEMFGSDVLVDGNDGWSVEVASPDRVDVNGFSSDWVFEQRRNRKVVESLEPGWPLESVSGQMGDPVFSETYGDHFRVNYYRTHMDSADGYTDKRETTALVFEDDILVDWGLPNIADASTVVTGNWEAEQADNRKAIFELEEGATFNEAMAQLGEPSYRSEITEDVEILSFRTRSVSTDGVTSPNETTRLLFVDGIYRGAD